VREFDATGYAVGRARMVTDLADASADPTLVGDGGDGATLIWYDQFWNGVGESRDYVAQAVIRGIRSEWSPGTVETGSAGRDKLSGTAADDLLSGAGRRDVLKGLGGDDDLRGGGGNDRLLGARGRDHLEGGSGNDVLLGARGNDVLAGGRGDDVLVGGGGKDRFLFREQTGADTIRDFNAQKDVIVLEGALFGGTSTAGRPSVTETGGDTIISYVRSDIAARIVLEGVVDLDYDINFLSGPILIY
jgi:Ca2+-binding RTX toxin-like protein